ncbi:branched-chain amino acid ABC transporter permease [Haloplanus ruber]|uniref:Branched-chain amino acid ABC transporter permease n=1 Tax=Haloplanus ruber TaxID=869892 RepID=A0ABD6CSZ9_9EURY|nr:branched-chain amino acid ABC transporter permease [Haloplanus ruber]
MNCLLLAGVDTELVASLALNALSSILILALSALGLAVIYGFIGVINLAHGAYFTVGAYVVWLTSTELGIGFWPGFLLAPLVVAVVGLLTEVLIIQHLYERLLDTILATWGVALAIGEAIKLLFNAQSKEVGNPLPGSVDLVVTTYSTYRLFLMGVAAVVITVVFVLFTRTDAGVRLRAVIQDPTQASLLGLNETRMYQFSFAFGSALVGLAGAAVAPLTTVEPNMGISYLVQSFFAVILGGAGTLIGIVPGSIIVAGFSNVGTFFISPVVAQTLVFLLVVALIVVRPEGLLGGQ